jgi:IS1 family transposase
VDLKAPTTMNVLTTKQQLDVLRMLLEGGSINGTSRFTGIARETCTRLMIRMGEACWRFLDREMRDLDFEHLQLDELWTYCGKKKKQITGEEPHAHEIGEFYIFWALHEQTRLVPSFLIGRRDEGSAMEYCRDLAERTRFPKPHYSDAHDYLPEHYAPIMRISTDGFKAYDNAIDACFGPYAEYVQIVKNYSKAPTNKKGKQKEWSEQAKGHSSNAPADQSKKQNKNDKFINKVAKFPIDANTDGFGTSLVERWNLTARTGVRRLVRRTLCFSKKRSNLQAAMALYVTYYNYCWKVRTLKTTPAVAQGLVGNQWTLDQLYDELRQSWPDLFYLQPLAKKEVA